MKPQQSDFVDPFKTVGRKIKEDQMIWSKVKKNYFENKRTYYKQKMYTDEDKLNEVVDIDKTLNLIDFLSKTKGKKLHA